MAQRKAPQSRASLPKATKVKAKPKAPPPPPPAKSAKGSKSTTSLPTKPLAISYESDGVSIGNFERQSARGKSIKEYREQVLQAAEKSNRPMLQKVAAQLRKDDWTNLDKNPVDDDKAMKKFLDTTKYSAGTNSKADYDSTQGSITQQKWWAYMKYKSGKNLAWEADWQYKSSASYVDAAGVTQYADGLTYPGIASHKDTNLAIGSFVRLGEDENALRYARVLDWGSRSASANKIEENIAAARNQGDYNASPSEGSSKTTSVKSVGLSDSAQGGFNAKDGFLSNEETQYAGWLAENKHEPYDQIANRTELDETMERYKDDEAFQKYKEQVKAALAAQKKKLQELGAAGADQVLKGVKGTGVGEEQLQIVTAKKPTKQGDEVSEGRLGTYAGEDLQPVSTIESKTVQEKAVVTGNDKVDVGGPPTQKPLGPPPKPKPLKAGSRGSDVRAIQDQLRKLGYDIKSDGVFGPKTAAAVKSFQERTALASDGVVGARTGAMLFG